MKLKTKKNTDFGQLVAAEKCDVPINVCAQNFCNTLNIDMLISFCVSVSAV